MSLDAIFKPKSVAVIGASRDPKAIGHQVVKNLQEGNYEGKIFPVNPNADEIRGLKCYPSVLAIPEPVDLAIITVPARLCPSVVEECGKKGVKGLAIIASGFSEIGEVELERNVIETARKYGMRVLGPNIVGVMSNPMKLNAAFAPYLPYPGKITILSQSGALLIAMDARTWLDKVGISYMISLGNMGDLDFGDLIEYFDNDENTNVISLYVEGIQNGRKFLEVCKNSKKPIVTLKAGTSERGATAAASHTGSLAGSAKVYEGAFKQAGVIIAQDLNSLFDRSMALSLQPPMNGDNLLIITNGGGVGVLATDAAEKYGIPLKDAPESLKELMRKWMPPFGSPKNPVDLTGMADKEQYAGSILDAMLHPWPNGIVILYCETSFTDPMKIAESIYESVKLARERGATIPVTVSLIGGYRCREATEWLIERGIPTYNSPEVAVNAMAALREYSRSKERMNMKVEKYEADRNKVREIINNARKEGRNILLEPEAKEIFRSYGLPVPLGFTATSEEEAVKIAREVGFPVVMKIVSPQIIHKTEAGGVKVNIKTEEEVRQAFREIIENARKYNQNAEIRGVYVQHMAPWGTEVIIGSINDPQFGPTIMFGLGGIFVEVLKDVTFRVAPITRADAEEMIKEIKGYPILRGFRGEKPRDVESLKDALCRISQLVYEFENDISEVDANPVMVYENGLSIVDARIILRK